MVQVSQKAARRQRAKGALVGAVVGDALGAPFEFGPPGAFSARFPEPARGVATEMCGGGGWQPGEWTDDTQMALTLAGSLLDNDGLDEADLFARFVAWVAAEPQDVGIQTRSVLTSRRPWQSAASEHFAAGHRAAGNGSLMRTIPAAIFFAADAGPDTEDAARRISALTHGDPLAGDGCAIHHRMVQAALAGADPFAAMEAAIANVPEERRARWARVLAPGWTPDQATVSNGVVWPTLGTAVWALRHYQSFEQSMREVIDLGGDTDTVAAVTGGLLGAVHGIQAIPSRWVSAVHGELPGQGAAADKLRRLQTVALELNGEPQHEFAGWEVELAKGPKEIDPGLFVSNLDAVHLAPGEAFVISMCRTVGRVPQKLHRQVYIIDDCDNLDLPTVITDVMQTVDAVRAEGRPVLFHCQGGASRTGLMLKAWLVHSRGLAPDEACAEAHRLWTWTAEHNRSFPPALEAWAHERNGRATPRAH